MRRARVIACALAILATGAAGAGDWWQITVVDAAGNTGGYGSLARHTPMPHESARAA